MNEQDAFRLELEDIRNGVGGLILEIWALHKQLAAAHVAAENGSTPDLFPSSPGEKQAGRG